MLARVAGARLGASAAGHWTSGAGLIPLGGARMFRLVIPGRVRGARELARALDVIVNEKASPGARLSPLS